MYHKFHYDKNERLRTQDPLKILMDIGLKRGDVFMDIGSNDGFFTIPASKIVGKEGQVYAVDIDEEAIEKLKGYLKDMQIFNVETFISQGEDFLIDKNIADIVFLGTVLHDFSNPTKVLKNAFLMLKEGGLLIDFDWKKENTVIGPPMDIRLSEREASLMISKANFSNIEIKDISDNFYEISCTKG